MKWTSLRGADGVLGGDFVDITTPWGMRDKVSHLLLGAFAQLAHERWITPAIFWNASFVVLVAVLVELVEQHRFDLYGWSRSFSDEADGTDVLVTIAGGVIGWLLL